MSQLIEYDDKRIVYLLARAKTTYIRLDVIAKKSVAHATLLAIFIIFDLVFFYIIYATSGYLNLSFPGVQQIRDFFFEWSNMIYIFTGNFIITLASIFLLARSYLNSIRVREARRRLELAIREAEDSALSNDE